MVCACTILHRENTLVGYPIEEGAREQQPLRVLHLTGTRQLDCLFPGQMGVQHRLSSGLPHLPDLVAAVSVPVCPGKQRPVGKLARVVCRHKAVLGVKVRSDVLITGFGVHTRLHGCQRIVLGDELPVLVVLNVSGLHHVKVQPVIFVEVLGGVVLSRWVEGHQLAAPDGCADSLCHAAQDGVVSLALQVAVASKYPDNLASFVAVANPFTVDASVLRGEDFGSNAPSLVPLVAPCRFLLF